MAWLDLASNPECVRLFYQQPPSLDAVEALSLHFLSDTLHFGIEIVGIPDKRPKGWPADANAIQVCFAFMGLREVTLQGWQSNAVGRLILEPGANGGVGFRFEATSMRLEGVAAILYLSIASPGYVKSPEGTTSYVGDPPRRDP
jgi:Immunity protein 50